MNYLRPCLWLIVIYAAGAFVPLMNNDSAHHANIALHMYLTGDYVNLVDQGHDYLDKPHLLFWLAAVSYHIFGVTTFAYKFPSLLFSLLGIYATFRLGEHLYNRQTGKLAAVILATAFAFILSNNDVRMDAILTGSAIFSIWRLILFIHTRRWRDVVLGSLGLALGFAAKGMVGVAMPAVAVFIHLVHQRNWRMLLYWKWLLVPALTLLFISPVLYCFYRQFDMQKTLTVPDPVSGVRFILWSQNFERMQGARFGSSAASDPFFFVHTFLWAFLPWSLAAIVAALKRIKRALKTSHPYRQQTSRREIFTTGTVLFMLMLMSLSGFKLPHYLNILFPLFAILTAGYLTGPLRSRQVDALVTIQTTVAVLLAVFTLIVNGWIFPVQSLFITGSALFLVWCFYHEVKRAERPATTIVVTVYAALFANFLFSTNYYPQLLSYQAGNNLAEVVHSRNIPAESIYYLDGYERSNSFDFYTAHLTEVITTAEIKNRPGPCRIYTGREGLAWLEDNGIGYKEIASHPDYRVSEPKGKFFNPGTRGQELKQHYLIEVTG